MKAKKNQDLDLPPELEADEQEIYDNLNKYETRELDENGKMVKLKPGWK